MFGDYDNIIGVSDKIVQSDLYDIDFFVFSDKNIDLPQPWKLKIIKRRFHCNILENRYYKLIGTSELNNCDILVYLDGNIDIIGPIHFCSDTKDGLFDIQAYEHPSRNNVKDEIYACFTYSKITIYQYLSTLLPNWSIYKKSSYHLYECGILIKNPKSKALHNAMFDWFEIFRKNIKRDQFYFPYIIEKWCLVFISLGLSNIRSTNKIYSLRPHSKSSNSTFKKFKTKFLLKLNTKLK